MIFIKNTYQVVALYFPTHLEESLDPWATNPNVVVYLSWPRHACAQTPRECSDLDTWPLRPRTKWLRPIARVPMLQTTLGLRRVHSVQRGCFVVF